jgi:hypothetical protein
MSTYAMAADDDNYASPSSAAAAQASDLCRVLLNQAAGCFKKYGDAFYVQDQGADGLETFVQWENQLKNSASSWVGYRSGACRNSLGAYNWGVCNKDFYENSTTNNQGGKGSRIRFRVCVDGVFSDDCTSYSEWLYNDA